MHCIWQLIFTSHAQAMHTCILHHTYIVQDTWLLWLLTCQSKYRSAASSSGANRTSSSG